MVEMLYQGGFKANGKEYEVVLDKTNKKVNIFFKNIEWGDVECFQIDKKFVESFKEETLLKKTHACWLLLMMREELFYKNVFLQTFDFEMWDDIIVPLKNNKNSDIKAVVVDVIKI